MGVEDGCLWVDGEREKLRETLREGKGGKVMLEKTYVKREGENRRMGKRIRSSNIEL